MLDQETLRTFIKVAESKSFSKAAENLHKTPAAISYRIKMLEENLGTQLFLRTTRTVSLTPAGNHLLERCHQWLSWIDGMPDELNQINDGVERQVNLVVNNLLYNASTAAKLLNWLHQRFPFTQFRLSRQVYMGVWDAMLHDDFQLAIGVTGSESLSNTIRLLPFGEVSWVFVLSPTHPLATRSGALTDNMLRAYPAINIEDTSLKLTKRIAWLLPGQKEIKVPDLQTKLECHLQGMGIGFLPKNLCQHYIDNGQLITKEVENKRQPSPLSLAWIHHERTGKAVREIVSLFRHNDEKITGFLTNIDRYPNLE
ncbi:HTH-type transcriptional activator AllS [Limnobaculum parvum]|uniref:HTH-type transcriptional activator AllS n=1 Tax=Limnobaculum parvum TaxID=2172103 RepID=A0A2Y9TV70_9GAMM|nr:HTH-type transcriptional activator AllS [Limnobaculum parvum]AWH87583.1 HTH-type transcriptional activator AllS [Limnobaculum parvum]